MDFRRLIEGFVTVIQEKETEADLAPTLHVKTKLEERFASEKDIAVLHSIQPPLFPPSVTDDAFLCVLENRLVSPKDFLEKIGDDPLQREVLYRMIEHASDPRVYVLSDLMNREST